MQFVVGLGDKVAPTDIEEGMRVGYAAPIPIPAAFPNKFINLPIIYVLRASTEIDPSPVSNLSNCDFQG